MIIFSSGIPARFSSKYDIVIVISPVVVAEPAEIVITLPMTVPVLIVPPVVAVAPVNPGTLSGSTKSILIVPSVDIVSNVIDKPSPSTVKPVLPSEIEVKTGSGSWPETSNSPGDKIAESVALSHAALVHVNPVRLIPVACTIPVGISCPVVKEEPVPKVVPVLNVWDVAVKSVLSPNCIFLVNDWATAKTCESANSVACPNVLLLPNVWVPEEKSADVPNVWSSVKDEPEPNCTESPSSSWLCSVKDWPVANCAESPKTLSSPKSKPVSVPKTRPDAFMVYDSPWVKTWPVPNEESSANSWASAKSVFPE